jgi:hypothetical protein
MQAAYSVDSCSYFAFTVLGFDLCHSLSTCIRFEFEFESDNLSSRDTAAIMHQQRPKVRTLQATVPGAETEVIEWRTSRQRQREWLLGPSILTSSQRQANTRRAYRDCPYLQIEAAWVSNVNCGRVSMQKAPSTCQHHLYTIKKVHPIRQEVT